LPEFAIFSFCFLMPKKICQLAGKALYTGSHSAVGCTNVSKKRRPYEKENLDQAGHPG
jgi:hypothetical protein